MKTLVQDRATAPRFPILLRCCGGFTEGPRLGLKDKPPLIHVPPTVRAVWLAAGGYLEATSLIHHQMQWSVDQIGFHVYEEVEDLADAELEEIAKNVWPTASRSIDVEVLARLVLLLKEASYMIAPATVVDRVGWRSAGANLAFDNVVSWDDLDAEQRKMLPADTAVNINPGMLRTMQFGPLEMKEFLETNAGFEDHWHMMGRVKIGMMCVA